jgi:hypothetical protein
MILKIKFKLYMKLQMMILLYMLQNNYAINKYILMQLFNQIIFDKYEFFLIKCNNFIINSFDL